MKKRKKDSPPVPLSLSEESSLVLYYQWMVSSLCSLFTPPLPPSVQLTAQLYLHRFYVRHSVASYHPKQIVLTALMLSCKVEEHYVAPVKIAEKSKGKDQRVEDKVEEIVRLEVPLLEGIGFHLRCYHPLRAVKGHVKACAEREGWTKERRREAEESALALVHAAYLTDAPLLFSHSQIALAAVHLALTQRQMTQAGRGAAALTHSHPPLPPPSAPP